MNRRIRAIGFTAAASLLTASCSILAPQRDPSRFYVLTPTTESTQGEAATRDLLIGLGPIKLPDYLDRSQMATRVGANEVRFSDIERWAEPLDGNFARVLKEDLANILGTERIVSLPSFVPIALQFEIPMEVVRFESDAQGSVDLVARWAIRRGEGKRELLYTNESHVSEAASGRGTDAEVGAMSRAVAKLSEEIATELRRLAAAHH